MNRRKRMPICRKGSIFMRRDTKFSTNNYSWWNKAEKTKYVWAAIILTPFKRIIKPKLLKKRQQFRSHPKFQFNHRSRKREKRRSDLDKVCLMWERRLRCYQRKGSQIQKTTCKDLWSQTSKSTTFWLENLQFLQTAKRREEFKKIEQNLMLWSWSQNWAVTNQEAIEARIVN